VILAVKVFREILILVPFL